jgi:hypothetical protein
MMPLWIALTPSITCWSVADWDGLGLRVGDGEVVGDGLWLGDGVLEGVTGTRAGTRP